MWVFKKGGSGMRNEIFYSELSPIKVPEYKSKLIYGNYSIMLTIKPNFFMKLFLKVLGVKVEVE